jgi:hypothetical protein
MWKRSTKSRFLLGLTHSARKPKTVKVYKPTSTANRRGGGRFSCSPYQNSILCNIQVCSWLQSISCEQGCVDARGCGPQPVYNPEISRTASHATTTGSDFGACFSFHAYLPLARQPHVYIEAAAYWFRTTPTERPPCRARKQVRTAPSFRTLYRSQSRFKLTVAHSHKRVSMAELTVLALKSVFSTCKTGVVSLSSALRSIRSFRN